MKNILAINMQTCTHRMEYKLETAPNFNSYISDDCFSALSRDMPLISLVQTRSCATGANQNTAFAYSGPKLPGSCQQTSRQQWNKSKYTAKHMGGSGIHNGENNNRVNFV